MSNIFKVVSAILVLIGLYLVLNRGRESVNIINAMAGNAVKGIVALQGR